MSRLPERIELLAVARLEKMIVSDKDADTRATARMILDRSMPEPKIDPVEVADE